MSASTLLVANFLATSRRRRVLYLGFGGFGRAHPAPLPIVNRWKKELRLGLGDCAETATGLAGATPMSLAYETDGNGMGDNAAPEDRVRGSEKRLSLEVFSAAKGEPES